LLLPAALLAVVGAFMMALAALLAVISWRAALDNHRVYLPLPFDGKYTRCSD
jgi:hypothetical protein